MYSGIENIVRAMDSKARIRGDFSSVTSIIGNSKLAESGALFVCLRGTQADGHRFALEAYKKGCRHFLCERELFLPEA